MESNLLYKIDINQLYDLCPNGQPILAAMAFYI